MLLFKSEEVNIRLIMNRVQNREYILHDGVSNVPCEHNFLKSFVVSSF